MYAINTPKEERDWLIFCRDLPMVNSFASDEADIPRLAQGAIIAVLSSLIDDNQDIPEPTPLAPGERLVPLPARVQQKIRIYQAMRAKGWRMADLARAMGVNHLTVSRLIDPCHASTHEQIDQATWALGMASETVFVPVNDAPHLVKSRQAAE